MIPGKTNRIRLLAEEPGVYFGACAEYCGGPHALMLFRVRALPPADYARWVRRESGRSEEHTSELQSLMRISYAVFCLKKQTPQTAQANDERSTRKSDTTIE